MAVSSLYFVAVIAGISTMIGVVLFHVIHSSYSCDIAVEMTMVFFRDSLDAWSIHGTGTVTFHSTCPIKIDRVEVYAGGRKYGILLDDIRGGSNAYWASLPGTVSIADDDLTIWLRNFVGRGIELMDGYVYVDAGTRSAVFEARMSELTYNVNYALKILEEYDTFHGIVHGYARGEEVTGRAIVKIVLTERSETVVSRNPSPPSPPSPVAIPSPGGVGAGANTTIPVPVQVPVP